MFLSKETATEAKITSDTNHDIDDNGCCELSSSSSSTDSDQAPKEIDQFRQDNNEIPTTALRMLNFCREFAICLLVMLTYAALTKDPPKVTKAPAAYPFFPKNSLIADLYRGEISKAIEHAGSSDIVFVMFYAPWDAESQAARKEYETAARYMQDYVTFTAVNCWQPHSECRNQYSKVYRWPVLIAYPSHGRGVQYSGPMSAPHIIRFLQKVCNPILRLTSEKPRNFKDAYIIAELNASPGSLDFAVLYITSLKYLEKDPQYRINFYVKPSSVLEPSLQLYLWNETFMYPIFDKPWTVDEVLKWIFQSAHQVTSWVLPSGSKSIALQNTMQNGPSIIMFTPKNPLQFSIDYYSMLQEIAQEYFNCEENVMLNLHSISIKLKRAGNLLEHKSLKSLCKSKPDIYSRKITSHLKPVGANISSCSQNNGKKDCNLLLEEKMNYFCSKHKSDECIQAARVIVESTGKVCDDSNKVFTYPEAYKTSMISGTNDPRSPQNLARLAHRERCKQFLTAEKLQPAIFETKNYPPVNEGINVTGLACASNKSLTFIAMDSLLHYHFAQRLGVDLSRKADKSAVLIINDRMESHYIMQGSINGQSIREFIYNFTKNRLVRSLDSLVTLNLTDTQHPLLKNKFKDKSKIVVEELDTSSFLTTVLQENKAVIVFYYTRQCSFCNGISYAFLTAARKLSYVGNLIFARIDGDTNNLPWEYTMESYPTILFFPANRKSESRVFPSSVPITVPNLLGFILANLDPTLKLQAMWSICNQTKVPKEKSLCYSSILGETLTLIDSTLREWRKSNKRQKQVLLHKLKQLRQLHLLFAHSPEKRTPIQTYFKNLNSKLSHSEDYHDVNRSKRYKDEL